MIALIRDVRGRGLDAAEIREYVNEKLNQGIEALATYLFTFADTAALLQEAFFCLAPFSR